MVLYYYSISYFVVMMMGTEDRKAGHEFVPMNPQVYDFVVFRSTDIKDLQVCEVPQQQQQQPPQMHYMDPAIVNQQQYYQQTVHQQQQPPQQMQPPKLQFGAGRSPVVEASYVPAPAAPQQQPAALKFGSGPSMAQAAAQPKSQAPPAPMQPPKVHPATSANLVSMTPKADAKAEQQPTANASEPAGTAAKVMTYSTGTKRQELVENRGQFAPPPTKGSYAAMASHGAASHNNSNGAPAAARANLERPGKFRAPTQPTAQYNQQFSMTQSTASAQGKLSAAQEEVFRQLSGGNFYEKSSFFDNISCEAKDGKEGLRNERNWNMETFGVAAPPQTSYNSHRGGRGRGGYQGRGGHRGGQGAGNSYHRGGHQQRGGQQQNPTQA